MPLLEALFLKMAGKEESEFKTNFETNFLPQKILERMHSIFRGLASKMLFEFVFKLRI